MKCPNCQHVQDEGTECLACGIVFEKFRERRQPVHETAEVPPKEPAQPPGRGRWPRIIRIVVLLALVGLAALFAMKMSPTILSAPNIPNALSNSEAPMAGGLTERLTLAMDPQTPIERARLATVLIETQWGSGSGFFAGKFCLIVTNRHVLDGKLPLSEIKEQIEEIEIELDRFDKEIEILEKNARKGVPNYSYRTALSSEGRARYTELVKDLHLLEARKLNIRLNLDRIRVQTVDGTKYTADVGQLSQDYDLGILLLTKELDCPILKPAPREEVRIGSPVFAIGSPLGLEHSVASGIVSGWRGDADELIQIDVPINPGNSGGPLIDPEGRVIGINTMRIMNAEGLGFSIPMRFAYSEFGHILRRPNPAQRFAGPLTPAGLAVEGSASAQSADQTQRVAYELIRAQRALDAVHSFWVEFVELPDSNRQAGVEEPKSFANGVLQSLEIREEGKVILTFTEKSGVAEGKVQFEFVPHPRGGSRWTCSTSDYEQLPQYDSRCTFDPRN